MVALVIAMALAVGAAPAGAAAERQRFSSPLTAFSRNVADEPGNALPRGQQETRDFRDFPSVPVCF
jgi:hypothetical protein